MKWILGGVIIGGIGVFLIVRRLRGRFVVVTVEGTSMAPTLAPGDQVVVVRRKIDAVRSGDVIVLRPPKTSERYESVNDKAWNIKRAAALPGDPVPDGIPGGEGIAQVPPRSLVVFGDNSDSVDSRQRGFFPADQILGVAIRMLGGRTL
ncbi:S26 family signal peptidase [Streptomyces sp. NBC_01142]|uniref:S26 family signal peptidase n=1 Tax=Streptomyces sp. NBC_01142 TaxID=2975865 RepID=UPI0022506B63|nr:S26 family signal peptidase [Streptomyces sp. NBC_01142]MCX4822349.1 S26 family signal peptidase [Streptomyces sp. NBC_01142]